MKTKRTKRPACKPVKAWAVVEIPSDKIDVDALFLKRADAVAFHHEAERIVRVEIREIRRTKR